MTLGYETNCGSFKCFISKNNMENIGWTIEFRTNKENINDIKEFNTIQEERIKQIKGDECIKPIISITPSTYIDYNHGGYKQVIINKYEKCLSDLISYFKSSLQPENFYRQKRRKGLMSKMLFFNENTTRITDLRN